MGPLRIVLDTNVIVSAALKPAGLERAVVVECFRPPVQTFVSDDMLWEYSRILSKPKLQITTARAAKLLSIIRARAHSIRPREHLSVCTDPDDNIFLDCAEAAQADYLITGNKRHFPSVWRSTRIINAREFMNVMASEIL